MYDEINTLNTNSVIGLRQLRQLNMHTNYLKLTRLSRAPTVSAINKSNITTLMIRRRNHAHIELGSFSDFTNRCVLDLNCNSKLNCRCAISSINTVLLDKTDPGSYGVTNFRDLCSKSHFWESVRLPSLRDVQLKLLVFLDMLCISDTEELSQSHNTILGIWPMAFRILPQLHQLSTLRVLDLSRVDKGT